MFPILQPITFFYNKRINRRKAGRSHGVKSHTVSHFTGVNIQSGSQGPSISDLTPPCGGRGVESVRHGHPPPTGREKDTSERRSGGIFLV